MSLDAIDQRILAILKRNARTSHAQIADKVSLSRNAVRQRIERMEARGVISGYTLAHTGQRSQLTALIFIDRHDRMKNGKIVTLLRTIPEVRSCEVLSGEHDILVRVEADDAKRIREIWSVIAELPETRDITTTFVLSQFVI